MKNREATDEPFKVAAEKDAAVRRVPTPVHAKWTGVVVAGALTIRATNPDEPLG